MSNRVRVSIGYVGPRKEMGSSISPNGPENNWDWNTRIL